MYFPPVKLRLLWWIREHFLRNWSSYEWFQVSEPEGHFYNFRVHGSLKGDDGYQRVIEKMKRKTQSENYVGEVKFLISNSRTKVALLSLVRSKHPLPANRSKLIAKEAAFIGVPCRHHPLSANTSNFTPKESGSHCFHSPPTPAASKREGIYGQWSSVLGNR